MRKGWLAAGLGVALAGCATGPARYPVEAVRYHYDPVAGRGTVAVEPFGPDAGAETQAYAAAVADQLQRAGFTPAPPGAAATYRASVQVTHTQQPLAPRDSGLRIGLGGGGYSGGYRGGGVGLGGGVSFPIGGHRQRFGTVTELAVRLRRGPDAVWEGQARTLTEGGTPAGDTGALAPRLVGALFGGFPGESGRSIEVR